MVRFAAAVAMIAAAAAAGEPARVAAARKAQGAEVAKMLAAAGAPEPRALLIRVFKQEKLLELWAAPGADERLALVKAWPICQSSGGPGPKLREGDGQVPEGFYEVSQLNPWSQFHLSLRVSYPNAADRARSQRARTGGDIFIHGGCVTIGCMPIGDVGVEQLYLAVQDAKARAATVAVHIFPARMEGAAWESRDAAASPALRAFWDELRPGWARFEAEHRLPHVTIENGRYRF